MKAFKLGKVIAVLYLVVGLAYSLGPGYYRAKAVKSARGDGISRAINRIDIATVADGFFHICVSVPAESQNVFSFEVPLTSLHRPGDPGWDVLVINEAEAQQGCNVGLRAGDLVPIRIVEFRAVLTPRLIKLAEQASADEPAEHVVYFAALIDPDSGRVIADKQIILVSRKPQGSLIVRFERRAQEERTAAWALVPLAIAADMVTYPYFIYRLIASGG